MLGIEKFVRRKEWIMQPFALIGVHATIGLAFYLGKITSGAPALNLLDAVKQESKVIQTGNPQVIGKACEQEFTARMTAVDAMGKALSSGK